MVGLGIYNKIGEQPLDVVARRALREIGARQDLLYLDQGAIVSYGDSYFPIRVLDEVVRTRQNPLTAMSPPKPWEWRCRGDKVIVGDYLRENPELCIPFLETLEWAVDKLDVSQSRLVGA